jgi:hypothetical protein
MGSIVVRAFLNLSASPAEGRWVRPAGDVTVLGVVGDYTTLLHHLGQLCWRWVPEL